MVVRLLMVAALVLPVLLGTGRPAAGVGGDGAIVGQVVGRSAAGSVVGELEVQLHAFARDTGKETASPAATRTDGTGRFSFERLDTDARTGYVVTVEYRGVTYSSEDVAFQAGETSKTIEIGVYEPTHRPDAIRLRQQHLIVTPDPESATLRVVEIAVLQNAGDTTFVGAGDGGAVETFRLLLPAEAYDVDMDGLLAAGAALVPGGVAYSGPLRPGQTQLVLSYLMEYRGRAVSLRKALSLTADSVDVMIEDFGLMVQSRELSGPAAYQVGGRRFLRLTGRDLAAGSVLAIEISGSLDAARPSAPGGALDPLAPLGLLALAGVSGYLLLAPMFKGRRRTPTRGRRRRVKEEDPDEDLEEEPVPE